MNGKLFTLIELNDKFFYVICEQVLRRRRRQKYKTKQKYKTCSERVKRKENFPFST